MTARAKGSSISSSFALYLAALAPALAAIWLSPAFSTQDGPAHLYNAQIIVESFDSSSPFRSFYEVKWQPLPNWAGPFTLSCLVAVFPPGIADRIMTTVTLVAFGASVLWLRRRVGGAGSTHAAALLSALMAMNAAWLLGFTSFLLGSCFFSITLGVWWKNRNRLNARDLGGLAALLVLGYFCHLVSLGLTVIGLLTLAWVAPLDDESAIPSRDRARRVARTAISLAPLVPLGLYYRALAARSGPLRPLWHTLENPWSPAEWFDRLNWVDPITLAIKARLPLTSEVSRWYYVFAPIIWTALALLAWWYARAFPLADRHSDRSGQSQSHDSQTNEAEANVVRPLEQRGWLTLALLLALAGYFGPDSLGATHGDYLPQRVVLMGFVAFAAVFSLPLDRWSGRISLAALIAAVVLQSLVVIDYASFCDRTAGQFIRARDIVGRNRRIATLLTTMRDQFRSNALLHADNLLGIGTHNIVWNNYETLHYYFPVQFRAEVSRPIPSALESISIRDDPAEAESRLEDWMKLVKSHAESIDEIVIWKRDPRLEAVIDDRFELFAERGDLRVFRKRPPRVPGP